MNTLSHKKGILSHTREREEEEEDTA